MKNLAYFVVGMLIISSSAALVIGKEAAEYEKISVIFDNINIEERKLNGETFIQLDIEGTNARLDYSGKPMLPVYSQTLNLPFGSKIISYEHEISEIQNIALSKKISPAPKPVIIGQEKSDSDFNIDQIIYNSDELYPENWFDSYLGGGLDENNEHKTFVTIKMYPVRYSPNTNTIQYIENFDLKIKYQSPETNLLTGNGEYDMVIITPAKFSGALQKLVDHKNSYGISTTIKTTEDIYDEYDGVDKPEQIKYFVKDAIEKWDIKYVMVVGGLKSIIWAVPRDDANQGTKGWYVPVRYTNLEDGGDTSDPGFISDLYYADIFDSEGGFSSWDTNENGDFAEWSFLIGGSDVLDLYPDVYIGRLACRNTMEVNIMVDKIIEYETNTYGQDWFNTMIGIGGDSHADHGTDFNEGEVACEHIFERYMTEFNPIKIYASFRYTNPEFIPSDVNMVREISKGCGFLLFEGHGSPGSWNTHWPGYHNWDDTPGGISCYDFFDMSNDGKYPILVVGGCHNSQFNISLVSTYLNMPSMWTYGQPYAECFDWHMVRKVGGGAIASLGNTGLGYGATGDHGDRDGDGEDLPDTVEGAGGYQIVQFFKTYDEGIDILGEVWGGAERKFLDTFPAMTDKIDTKTVEEWPLLGDPSLKIGGYPS